MYQIQQNRFKINNALKRRKLKMGENATDKDCSRHTLKILHDLPEKVYLSA